MKRSILAGTVLAALVGAPALAQAPAAAPDTSQRTRMTTCNADAKTQGLKGPERKTFMSSCLKGEPPATAAAAVPTPAAPAPAAPAGKAAGRQPSPAQQAERQRITQCGEQWRTEKAAGRIPAGQTWPKYWSACNTRMKGG